jgi:hypothetical protein
VDGALGWGPWMEPLDGALGWSPWMEIVAQSDGATQLPTPLVQTLSAVATTCPRWIPRQ